MTIYNRELNARLSNLYACAEHAPEGTYERAKQAKQCLDDCADSIFAIFKEHGFKLKGVDGFRDLEASLYGLLLDANPEEYGLQTGEGFGAAMDTPARDRVIANTIRDLKAFEALGLL